MQVLAKMKRAKTKIKQKSSPQRFSNEGWIDLKRENGHMRTEIEQLRQDIQLLKPNNRRDKFS